jgi:2-polyprenyl-3-methyl-5-hydroxy-6-metoxy-1,4-benzoquinol methylase
VKRERWNEKWRERGAGARSEPNRFLVEEVSELPAGRALDLACGAGRNAIWLAERGWSVTGVDYSEVGLAEARRRASERGVDVEWILADLTEWSPPSAAFDLVCVLYLQLPAAERRVVLGRAAQALAPGGTILVAGHDLANLVEGYGGPKSADVLYTTQDLAADLAQLEIERAERAVRPVEDEHGLHEAVDALLLARRPG